ncbi:hypothetical protein G5V57_19045 [Nordella sp. HKS 07]|uniref:hypothetical protein n=1 Tax=Nordella sp. HKS 07 TaxID=2712222 RepID=UPI0013E14D66|nr:hypothetical protein [Nordella sp. HKS 07]QIG49624.1 hypothetical protein G5V57_19045 [Nordella sp. HKS 07]
MRLAHRISMVRVMGTILTFPRDRVPQPARAAHEGPAEILIFPGVRIERYDFSLADRLPPPRRRGRPSRMQALDHDEFGLKQSKLINVIDSNV